MLPSPMTCRWNALGSVLAYSTQVCMMVKHVQNIICSVFCMQVEGISTFWCLACLDKFCISRKMILHPHLSVALWKSNFFPNGSKLMLFTIPLLKCTSLLVTEDLGNCSYGVPCCTAFKNISICPKAEGINCYEEKSINHNLIYA